MVASLRQNNRDAITAIVLFGLSALGVGLLQLPQLNKISDKNTIELATLKREVEAEKLRLNLLKQLPTFGFDNLIADWTLINFFQYFGDDEVRQQTGYSLSPEYFEVVLSRDPRFLQAYFFLSTSTSMYAAMPERSVAMMNQGLKFLSPTVPQNSYYIWRYKGIDELLFLGNAEAAKQSFTIAADWASTYADESSQQVAAISRRTAEFLERNPQSNSAQISAWTMVLNSPVDDATRKIAIDRIAALGGKISTTPEGGLQVIMPTEK